MMLPDIDDEDKAEGKGRGFRLDLSVNLALVVFLICQLGAFIWLFSGLSADVNILMTTSPNQTSAINTLTTDVNGLGIRTSALESRVASDESSVSDLATKRDGQIAALQQGQSTLAQTVASQTASLADISSSVNRILNLLQTGKGAR